MYVKTSQFFIKITPKIFCGPLNFIPYIRGVARRGGAPPPTGKIIPDTGKNRGKLREKEKNKGKKAKIQIKKRKN